MKKKTSKEIIIFQQIRNKLCSLCQNKQGLSVQSSKILIKKFYQPQIQSYNFRNINDIIFEAYSNNYFLYEQMLKDTSQEHIQKFNDWNSIVQSIKKVILQNCQNNNFGYVDFKQQCYDITLTSYLRKKQLLKKTKNSSTPYKSSFSTQQTASDKNLLDFLEQKIVNKKLQKVATKRNSVKVNDPVTNTSIIQLQKLTKNLDAMVQPLLRKQRKSMKTKSKMISPKKNRIPLQNNFIDLKAFKESLQKQISVINKNQQDVVILDKLSENKCKNVLQINDIKETYGLKISKPVSTKKKQKLFSKDKIAVPMTPKPRFQFSNNQYEERFTYQTPRIQLQKVSNTQSPCLYRTNLSSRNSTTSIQSLKKSSTHSNNKKHALTKLKSPSTKLKK